MGVNFLGGSFLGGNFPRTNKYINYFLKTLLSFYMMFFSQFPHVFSITTRFTTARREFLTHIITFFEKWKGNSFDTDFRPKEVTGM